MMLTRENIKQAIDAIGTRVPEIAYTLHTMLGKGRIDLLPASEILDDKRLYFLFGGQKVFVNKYQFFTSGTPCLEQVLLIHYGEMAQTRSLFHHHPFANPGKHVSKTDTAGLCLMLDYEIDLALDRLKKQIALKLQKKGQADESLWALRQRLKKLSDIRNDNLGNSDFKNFSDDPLVLFQGVISDYTKAFFMRFSFSRETLMEAARVNLEFFHIRFLLNCLVSGTDHLLFTCIAKGRIQGLMFLEKIRKLFYRGFEVKYVATLGKSGFPNHPRPVKGVGTFLMAGVWMFWKTSFPEVKEIFLESEIEAEGFYISIGFIERGPHRYILKSPQGRLLVTIAAMAEF